MSKSAKQQAYQFKVSLLEVHPVVWRRIQVPDYYTFSNLHDAIQKAMGWENSHLYAFFTGITRRPISEHNKIQNMFSLENENDTAHYEYDFGDSWVHEVLLEKILPIADGVRYPICIAGEMACPPEDCGGVPGYANLLEIIKNPRHPEYRSMIEWLGDKFYPEKFDPKDVCFGAEV